VAFISGNNLPTNTVVPGRHGGTASASVDWIAHISPEERREQMQIARVPCHEVWSEAKSRHWVRSIVHRVATMGSFRPGACECFVVCNAALDGLAAAPRNRLRLKTIKRFGCEASGPRRSSSMTILATAGWDAKSFWKRKITKCLKPHLGHIRSRALAAERRPDVIIFDPGLPDVQWGLLWLHPSASRVKYGPRALGRRAHHGQSRGTRPDGAKRLFGKPFDTADCWPGLRVLQRCFSSIPEESVLTEGDLKVNMTAHEVKLKRPLLMLTCDQRKPFFTCSSNTPQSVTWRPILLRSIWEHDSKNKLARIAGPHCPGARKLE